MCSAPATSDPDVHELAGPVGVRLAQLRWDIEHKRAASSVSLTTRSTRRE